MKARTIKLRFKNTLLWKVARWYWELKIHFYESWHDDTESYIREDTKQLVGAIHVRKVINHKPPVCYSVAWVQLMTSHANLQGWRGWYGGTSRDLRRFTKQASVQNYTKISIFAER